MKRTLFALVFTLFALGSPIMAQETDEPPTPTQEVTAEPTPVETPVPEPEQPTGETLVGRLAGYVAAFVAGVTATATAAWLALPRLLSQVRNDRVMLALIEGLTNSAPKDLIDKAITVGKAAGDLSAILEEVTDGVPVSSKPPVS
jgi:hypothetical protein